MKVDLLEFTELHMDELVKQAKQFQKVLSVNGVHDMDFGHVMNLVLQGRQALASEVRSRAIHKEVTGGDTVTVFKQKTRRLK